MGRRGRRPGTLNGPERGFNIPRIRANHQTIMRLIVTGMKNTEIAEVVGCTPQTVSNVRRSDITKREIARLQQAATQMVLESTARIQNLSGAAVDKLEYALDAEEAPLRLQVETARDILSRAGISPITKAHVVNAHLTQEDIEDIKRRAMEVSKEVLVDSSDVTVMAAS